MHYLPERKMSALQCDGDDKVLSIAQEQRKSLSPLHPCGLFIDEQGISAHIAHPDLADRLCEAWHCHHLPLAPPE